MTTGIAPLARFSSPLGTSVAAGVSAWRTSGRRRNLHKRHHQHQHLLRPPRHTRQPGARAFTIATTPPATAQEGKHTHTHHDHHHHHHKKGRKQQEKKREIQDSESTAALLESAIDQTPVNIRTGAPSPHQRERLVILGAGWAGFRILKSIDFDRYDVSIISPRNHFVFTPLLASACSGTLAFRSIIEPIRRARETGTTSAKASFRQNTTDSENAESIRSDGSAYRFFEASCKKIDTQRRRILCDPNHPQDPHFTLEYDKLVLAVGNEVNDYGIEGVRENCMFLKEVRDARRIRQRLIECFERASNPNTPIYLKDQLLHFVVVGAGPTGIEAAAEIHDLIESDMYRLYPPDIYQAVNITVLEAGQTVLGAFDASLQMYTRKKFERSKIRIHTRAMVVAVPDEGTVNLADGTSIKCGMVLWSAGNGPRRLMAENDRSPGMPKDRNSRVIVDDWLRVKGVEDVYALGDCSHMESNPLPATAQVAQQQGAFLVNYFNKAPSRKVGNSKDDSEGAERDRKEPAVPPFAFQNKGVMAYIGDYSAVTDVAGIKSGGFLSFLLWRSAYLTKLVSIKNKIMVPLDWMHALIFGRDTSQF